MIDINTNIAVLMDRGEIHSLIEVLETFESITRSDYQRALTDEQSEHDRMLAKLRAYKFDEAAELQKRCDLRHENIIVPLAEQLRNTEHFITMLKNTLWDED